MEIEILKLHPDQSKIFSIRILPRKILVRNFSEQIPQKITHLKNPREFAENNFIGFIFHYRIIWHAINTYNGREDRKYIIYKFLGSKYLLEAFHILDLYADLDVMQKVYYSISHLTNEQPPELIGEYMFSQCLNFHNHVKAIWIRSFHESCCIRILTLDNVRAAAVKDKIVDLLGEKLQSNEYMNLLRKKNPETYRLLEKK
jgi:hypothetical protein